MINLTRLYRSAALGLAMAAAGGTARAQSTAIGLDGAGQQLAADIDLSAPPSRPQGPDGAPASPDASPVVDPSAATGQARPAAQSSDSGRHSSYCDKNLGTWFYCHDDQQDQADQTQSPDAIDPASSTESDLAAAQKFKADMEKARTVAVWNPTEENIRRYYAYQQITMTKAGLFADQNRRMIWAHPELDYTLDKPVGDLAKTSYEEAQKTDRDLFFRAAYDQIGIFYIYRASCAACRVASPIIRDFGNRYGLPVKAISTDGSSNAEFPEFLKDQGQLASWGITQPVTPAYLLYQQPTPRDRDGNLKTINFQVTDGKTVALRPCENPKGCVTYIGAGVLTMDELADHLYVTLAMTPGQDF